MVVIDMLIELLGSMRKWCIGDPHTKAVMRVMPSRP